MVKYIEGNDNTIVTEYLDSHLENGIKKKVQKRIKTEYIYVIDSNQVKGSLKALGLNCPNCGAPIKSLDKKVCSYCQTGIVDLVKKSFVLNDIYEY